MFGLSGGSFRAFCGTLLVSLGCLSVVGIAMVLDRTRPVQGTTELILRVGLAGFCMFGAIGFAIPAVAAASALRRNAAVPGTRSTLLFSTGFALTSATLGLISVMLPAGPSPGPSRVPDVLVVGFLISVGIWLAGWLAGFFDRGPKP